MPLHGQWEWETQIKRIIDRRFPTLKGFPQTNNKKIIFYAYQLVNYRRNGHCTVYRMCLHQNRHHHNLTNRFRRSANVPMDIQMSMSTPHWNEGLNAAKKRKKRFFCFIILCFCHQNNIKFSKNSYQNRSASINLMRKEKVSK